MTLAILSVACVQTTCAAARVISGPALQGASQPLLAARPDGSIVAVWRDREGISAAVKPSAWKAWGSLQRLAAQPDTVGLRLVPGPGGQLAAAWTSDALSEGPEDPGGPLRVSVLDPGSTRFPAPELVAGSDASGGVRTAELAYTASGALTAMWASNEHQCTGPPTPCTVADPLYERTRPAGGAWGPTRTISANAGVDIMFRLSAAPDGSLTAVWNSGPWEWFTRRASDTGDWSPRARFSRTDFNSSFGPYDLPIVTAPDGTTLVAWSYYLRGGSRTGNDLNVSIRPAGAANIPGPQVFASVDNPNYSFEPAIGVDAHSRFTMLAREPADGDRTRVIAYTSRPDGTGWTTQTVASDLAADDTFELTVAPDGRAAAIFERSATQTPYRPKLYLTQRAASGGAWGREELLSDNPSDTTGPLGGTGVGGDERPDAVYGPDGALSLAWATRTAGSDTAIVLARRVKPRLALTVAPKRLTAKRRARVRVRVRAGFLPGSGTITLKRDGRRVKRIALHGRRQVAVRLPRLRAGRHVLTASLAARAPLADPKPVRAVLRIR